jgi:ferredoxin
MTRVSVDHDMCARSGFCVRIAPQLFRLSDEDDWAVVLAAEVPPEREEEAREAETTCPTGAIAVSEE